MRLIGLAAALLLACAGTAAPAQTFGAPIPGVCLFSKTAAIGASQAGQSLQAQIRQMQASLSGDLARQRAALEQQRRQIEARQNAIAPVEYQRQLAALAQQAQALEQQQNARFIAAQQRGQQQIDRVLNEALGRVVTRAACSLVLERDTAYGWNNEMDITVAVTREVDAALQQVSLQ
ncbi:OmpH family outer membrane protein [Sphingosinicella sp. LHD-64]|uniref:OmpH family outer membrane protein n=1 Tax=Sphingosinicella sp. LHD-64 TaxID=3072139 RepID=UPI00280DDE71|nr:OmpH family outer membrane protein [Sphingosinicella sp. LHD-64]MDQ8754665.1 OmpH family outer membrane protein [Sphingosinicella sp. LHD-64]